MLSMLYYADQLSPFSDESNSQTQMTNGDYHLWCLMGVQENSILCHGVLDKELLEIPESKICDFRHFFFRSHKNIAWLEVAMHHGTPHVVKACDSLTIH